MTKCKNCGYDEARHDAPAGSNTGTALCSGFASNTQITLPDYTGDAATVSAVEDAIEHGVTIRLADKPGFVVYSGHRSDLLGYLTYYAGYDVADFAELLS